MSVLSIIRGWFFGSGGTTVPPAGPRALPPPGELNPAREPAWWELPPPACAWTQEDGGHAPHIPDLRARLSRLLASANLSLPQLSHVAQRTLNALRDPDADVAQLARLISEDPTLTADLLRAANSALYAGVTEVTRLDAALVRIGQREARSLIVAKTMKALVIRTGGEERSAGECVWHATLATAAAAEFMAPRLGMSREDGFLQGLLVNIGNFVVLTAVHEFQRKQSAHVPRALMAELCDANHEMLGRRLATKWNLPAPLPELVGAHSAQPPADDPLQRPRALIQLAELCTAWLGYWPTHRETFADHPCFSALGVAAADVQPCLAELPQVVERRVEVL